MPRRFKGNSAKVCVALKFDGSTQRAVKIAEQYCLRTGAEMLLVHVWENPFTSNMAAIASSGFATIPVDVLQTAQDNIQEEAETKMLEISKEIKAPIKVSTRVLSGTFGIPAELIEAEAILSKCSMIIVGSGSGSHRFIPKGFSCALSLMSTSRLPVMAVNSHQTTDLEVDRLQMVIADDLTFHSLSAVLGGCELAFALGKTDIHHLHINGMTVDALKGALTTALASSHSQPDPEVSATEVFDMMVKHLEDRLESRTANMNNPLEIGACRYYKSLLTERSVTDGLENFVVQKAANLVVFGRHQTFHRKPFNIGQMPFYGMLALPCPVLVFPTKDD